MAFGTWLQPNHFNTSANPQQMQLLLRHDSAMQTVPCRHPSEERDWRPTGKGRSRTPDRNDRTQRWDHGGVVGHRGIHPFFNGFWWEGFWRRVSRRAATTAVCTPFRLVYIWIKVRQNINSMFHFDLRWNIHTVLFVVLSSSLSLAATFC